jgi:hypothetical protein
VGIFGQGPTTVDTLLGVVSDAGGSSVAQTLRPTLETLSQTPPCGTCAHPRLHCLKLISVKSLFGSGLGG